MGPAQLSHLALPSFVSLEDAKLPSRAARSIGRIPMEGRRPAYVNLNDRGAA